MHFGLKNIGATYLRLMNRIFKNQVGHKLKVYVDDIFVKNRSLGDHVQSLSETFSILRAHNMKLNPEMYAFSVRAGRFLGFLISESGIEFNPKKICAIMERPSPLTIKNI